MQRAYSFNILEYISQILTVTCNPSNPTSVGYKSVLKGLFCSILKYYPINRLPNISLFTDNIQHLLSNDDALCESFLDDLKDLDFLQVLKQRFPVSLDFVKIQTGLTSSSSINEIFTSFSNLNTFAMTIPLSRLQVKNDLVVLLQDEIIGGNIFKLSIPKNASGILVSNDPIVVFNISYSGWYYILASLDSYNNIDIEIIHLLNLLLEVSKHGYLSQLIHHSFSFPNLNDYEITNNSVIELVCRVLNTSVSKRDFKNIPSLLEILSCSIIENQELVWDFVISSPLFPNSSRLVMVDIFELEKTSATFSITRNFIKLITNLVDTYPTTSIKTKFIINSMQFIFGLVFPIQSTLKYKIKSEKYNLQQSILNLFVNVISTSNQEIQIFTIDKFNSSIHVKSLLELSCIGNKSVSELYVFGRFNECNVLEDIIIKSLKLVKYLIMYRIDNNLPISNLEVFIIERELIVDEENKNVVLVIAEYIKFEVFFDNSCLIFLFLLKLFMY